MYVRKPHRDTVAPKIIPSASLPEIRLTELKVPLYLMKEHDSGQAYKPKELQLQGVPKVCKRATNRPQTHFLVDLGKDVVDRDDVEFSLRHFHLPCLHGGRLPEHHLVADL